MHRRALARSALSIVDAPMPRLTFRKLLATLVLTAAFACGGKKEDKPSAKPADPKMDPKADTTATDPKPEAPKPDEAPKYSPETAKKLASELATCSSEFNCKPFEALVSFGAQGAPELLAVATDASAKIEGRRLAAKALGKIKAPDAGPKLVEAANKLEDSLAQGDFYEAAGECGGQATFDALIAEFAKATASTEDRREIPLRHGLRKFPAETLAWAKAELPKAKKQTSVADLVDDTATDAAAVQELLGAAKDPMAKNRLAKKAIELGANDPKLWDVFLTNLASKDQYDRADAGNFLAHVVAKVPEDKKAKFVELLKKANEGPKDPMLKGGLEKSLKALGG
jgi:hypothetical protein